MPQASLCALSPQPQRDPSGVTGYLMGVGRVYPYVSADGHTPQERTTL
jgi:hypothetical protein